MRRGSSTVSAYVDTPASISMSSSRFSTGVIVATLTAMTLATVSATESLAERRKWFDTPFGPAVIGLLAKKCEDSNAYRRDPEIQRRVIEAVASMPAFARSSVWVTTERDWVTLQGCLESTALRASLIDRPPPGGIDLPARSTACPNDELIEYGLDTCDSPDPVDQRRTQRG